MKEIKEGKAAELIFYNETNFYTILLFETNEEQFFAVGNMIKPVVGRNYRLTGEWKVHPKYGEQFVFGSFEELEPTSAEGIAMFLSSGFIRGIGPKKALAIVKKFGEDTLKVIEKSPERLTEVSGIGEAAAAAIAEGYKEHREYAETVLELSSYGISAGTSLKLYKAYGSEAGFIIRENPYELIDDIYGVGFKSADKIAAAVGIKPNSPNRIKSAITYTMKMLAGSGDCFVPEKELYEKVAMLLDLSRSEIEESAYEMVMDGKLYIDSIDDRKVYMLENYYRAERYVASKLYELCNSTLNSLGLKAENLIKQEEKNSGIELSEKQKKAITTAVTVGVSAITGGPGTGKSTIINTILHIFQSAGLSVLLAAPTGRAAKRMQQLCGNPASTIHRMLEYAYEENEDKMFFGKNESCPLEADCIIIDEFSMVDILLAEALLKAVKPGTRLVFVGDADQLPPVGAGSVLKDILASETILSCRLTDIFRQAKESAIVVNAHLINKGEYPCFNEKDKDCFMLTRNTDTEIANTIADLCSKRLPSFFKDINSYEDIQVLTPTRKGPIGSTELNVLLQSVLNPPSPIKQEKEFGSRIFREGDKVMQVKNNYSLEWKDLNTMQTCTGVFNGDIGIVQNINQGNGTIEVLYDKDRLVCYDYSTIEELEHAFALTVHKSQGSEFPVVVMPMGNCPPMLATRNLLYTAITRAKQAVVFVGNPNICNGMVENNSTQKRYSGLEYRLRKIWEIRGENN